MKSSDIRIKSVAYTTQDFRYRTPIKFGGVALERATQVDVDIVVENRQGQTARGFGSMPMSNVWAFPSKKLNYDQTLAAITALVKKISVIAGQCTEQGHPIDVSATLEHEYLKAAEDVQAEQKLPEKIPILATLVAASPFDAALHDAFGKSLGLNCYHTYGPDFMNHDLGHYLGKDFAGESLDRYVCREPQPHMPLYHLCGAVDPLDQGEVVKPVGDGLPETLAEWIPYSGLSHIKIKLNGDNLAWDVERVLKIERVAAAAQKKRGVDRWFYSLDFNEKCPNVAYLLDFLDQVKINSPAGFERIQYIEQPTSRDLKADRANVMQAASKIRPVVIDEALIDLESLLTARDMGYTGAALKACKGQGQSLILGAAAQKFGMFLCVQDLTCPGASLIQSASLAAHVPGVAAIEANSRQYVPVANKPWEAKFPGIFKVTDGTMDTSCLTGVGLGAV